MLKEETVGNEKSPLWNEQTKCSILHKSLTLLWLWLISMPTQHYYDTNYSMLLQILGSTIGKVPTLSTQHNLDQTLHYLCLAWQQVTMNGNEVI
jgi:hypothetical protein